MMRIRRLVACGAVLAAAQIGAAPTAQAGSDDFGGTWTSIDFDGSHQTLTVRGAGLNTRAVTYYDDVASSACSGDPAMVSGTGWLDGDAMFVRGVLVCMPGGNWVHHPIGLAYFYDGSTDTLIDDSGIIWSRA